MFFGNKARRRPHTTRPVEALESRAMLAASVRLTGNELVITGTTGNDQITVGGTAQSGRTTVKSGNQLIGSFPTQNIAKISATLMSGNDSMTIDMRGKSFTNMTIDLGGGSNEAFTLLGGAISNRLTIRANSSWGARVELNAVTVGIATASFGNGSGDQLSIRNSSLTEVSTTLGAGDDRFESSNSSFVRAYVYMQDGNDQVFFDRYSQVGLGQIVGGNGSRDLYRQERGARVNATVRDFEL
jgi:hypothetical protein